MLRAPGNWLLIVQTGIHQPLVTGAHRSERPDQVAIIKAAISARRLRQRVTQAHQQMLALIGELLRNFHLQKQ